MMDSVSELQFMAEKVSRQYEHSVVAIVSTQMNPHKKGLTHSIGTQITMFSQSLNILLFGFDQLVIVH